MKSKLKSIESKLKSIESKLKVNWNQFNKIVEGGGGAKKWSVIG